MESKPGDLAGLAESSTKVLVGESSTVSETQAADAAAAWEDVPDPDEDDLDDLDGTSFDLMLDMRMRF